MCKREMTLEQIGTPWAEEYRGSGRLTSRLSGDPTYMNTGEVAPGWVWVGDMTIEQFNAQFEREEEDYIERR